MKGPQMIRLNRLAILGFVASAPDMQAAAKCDPEGKLRALGKKSAEN